MNLNEYTSQPANLALASKLRFLIWTLTVVVLGLVGLMRQVKIPLPDGIELSFLPPVHAILNTLVAVLLVSAVVMIKRRNVVGHKRAINGALACSILFLLCYVAYHFTTEETSFGGTGAI